MWRDCAKAFSNEIQFAAHLWRFAVCGRKLAGALHEANARNQPIKGRAIATFKAPMLFSLFALSTTSAYADVVSRNRAQGKVSRQSSVALGGVAGRAVDGNRNGVWTKNSVTHTSEENEPFWEVDLGAAYHIDEVRIWNRTDCCKDRLKDFAVFHVNNRDGFPHRSFVDILQQPGVTALPVFAPEGIILNPQLPIRISGQSLKLDGALVRFLRVQLAGRGILSLAEVEVIESKKIAGPRGLADAIGWRSASGRAQKNVHHETTS